FQWLNRNVEETRSVLAIGEFRMYYADFDYRSSDWFDTPVILTEIRNSESNEAMMENFRARGIDYIFLNQAELQLYEEAYFQRRFTDEHWERFKTLREELIENAVWAEDGVYITLAENIQRAYQVFLPNTNRPTHPRGGYCAASGRATR